MFVRYCVGWGGLNFQLDTICGNHHPLLSPLDRLAYGMASLSRVIARSRGSCFFFFSSLETRVTLFVYGR